MSASADDGGANSLDAAEFTGEYSLGQFARLCDDGPGNHTAAGHPDFGADALQCASIGLVQSVRLVKDAMQIARRTHDEGDAGLDFACQQACFETCLSRRRQARENKQSNEK